MATVARRGYVGMFNSDLASIDSNVSRRIGPKGREGTDATIFFYTLCPQSSLAGTIYPRLEEGDVDDGDGDDPEKTFDTVRATCRKVVITVGHGSM